MAREDSIEAYKATTGYEVVPEEEAYSIVWHVLNKFGENGFYLSHTLRISGFIRLINHLRSKGFDCDNLIEQNLAIEK